MNHLTQSIIWSILEIYVIFGVGALARYLKFLDEEDLKKLSKISVHFLFPFLIFNQIVKNIDANELKTLWVLPIIGISYMLVGAIIGYATLLGLKAYSKDLKNTFLHFCVVNNFGFMPIIIMRNLWGESSLTNLFLLNIGSFIGYWSIGIAVLGEKKISTQLKNLLSPAFLSIFVAILINQLGFHKQIPDFFYKASHSLGQGSIVLMLFIVGASLIPIPIPNKVYPVIFTLFIRNIFLPIIYIALIWLTPLPENYRNLAYMVALMPAAISSTVITKIYGGDNQFSVQIAVASTLLAIFTIPFFIWVMLKLNIIQTL